MYKEIEIKLDDFDDDEVLEYVENCCKNYSFFREEIIRIAKKHISMYDFDDDEVLEYVGDCCEGYSVFREKIIKIAEKHISKNEIETTLDNLPKYPNQNYAKEIFEKMEFSKDLVKWILKTYGNQSNRGCKNDFCKS